MSEPALYVVATPIGNLNDMVPRAVEILQAVDVIAAEDTRRSAKLLHHFAIETPMLAYHEHSDNLRLEAIMKRLQLGQKVALISDAGTPLISDPGYRLVRAAREAGIAVIPVPGASALIAALSVAGLPSDRFVFEGFLAAKSVARCKQLEALVHERRTLVFYEAPHRIVDCLLDLQAIFGEKREIVLARELTKTYETIKATTIGDLHQWVAADANQQRGEMVLLVAGAVDVEQSLDSEVLRVLQILAAELAPKQAASLAAKITGVKKKALYPFLRR